MYKKLNPKQEQPVRTLEETATPRIYAQVKGNSTGVFLVDASGVVLASKKYPLTVQRGKGFSVVKSATKEQTFRNYKPNTSWYYRTLKSQELIQWGAWLGVSVESPL